MARLRDLKLKHRLYMQAYAYRHVDWRPGAQLRKPLSEATIAVVTTAAFFAPGQAAFDLAARGGDPSYREIRADAALETLRISHKSDAFDHQTRQRQQRQKADDEHQRP